MAQDPDDVMDFSEHVEILNKAIKKVAAELHDKEVCSSLHFKWPCIQRVINNHIYVADDQPTQHNYVNDRALCHYRYAGFNADYRMPHLTGCYRLLTL